MTTAAGAPLSSVDKLTALEKKLAEAKVELKKWSTKIENAAISSEERKEAKEEREFYLTRVTALEGQIAALQTGPTLSRAFVKLTPEDLGTGGFLARQLVLRNRTSLPPGFTSLGEGLWGMEDEVTSLYNRDWYIAKAGSLIASFDQEVRKHFIVAGNKGSGNTVFSFVLVVEALKQGFIVAYQNATDRFWIVGEKAKQRDDLPELAKVFTTKNFEPCLQPGVYEVVERADVALFNHLVMRPQVIYIIDVDETFSALIRYQGPKIIISSPNSDKLSRIGEEANPTYFYIPPWSWEELLELNEKLPTRAENPNHKYVRQDLEDLRLLFEVFGGIPRILFRNQSVQKTLELMDAILDNTPFHTWKSAFTRKRFSALPREVPGMLVHITERTDMPEYYKIEFASNDILHLFVRKYYQHCRQDVISFLNASTASRMISAMRGELVEECMHQGFTAPCLESLRDLEIRKLSGKTQFRPFQLPLMLRKFFRFLNMRDLAEVQLNEYYQPLVCNFPAVDAISLMERKVFDGPSATGLCGVGFQATVSKIKRKGVKREELSRVRDKLRALTNDPRLPLYLVFVTTPDGLISRQVLGRPKLPGDDEYIQFVIRGISFEVMNKVVGREEEGLDPDNDEEDDEGGEE